MKKSVLFLVIWAVSILPFMALAQEYVLEPPPQTLAGEKVIAQYGNESVTLADFWARIRFERWLYWRALAQLVNEQGGVVLDLANIANPYRDTLFTLFNFLANEEGFADFVWQRITREAFYRSAAGERGLATFDCAILAGWAQLIGWPATNDCSDSDEFAAARANFISSAKHYTGIKKHDLEASIRAQLLFADLRAAIREELPIINELPAIQSRQVRTDDLASSRAALEALEAGADFTTVMLQYGADQDSYGNSGELGYLTRGVISAELDQALFTAGVGEWIGPIESALGYHVARVTDTAPQVLIRHIQIPSRSEAEALRSELKAGADFATLARLHSQDAPTAARGGIIGYFTRTQLLPEMEAVIFDASVGELLGPIASPYGFHLIEVLDIRPRNMLAQARILVVETEREAENLLHEMELGAEFAALIAEHSRDEATRRSAGSIGYFRPDSERLPAEIIATVFDGGIGDLNGPFLVENGYALLQITDMRNEPFSLRAQHILLDSLPDAQNALQSLLVGADLAQLAREFSLDPSARGDDGDTLAFFTQGERSGLYLSGETHPALEAVIADAAEGAILGPIETELGYFILRIEERTTRYLNPLEMDEALAAAVDRWLQNQHLAQMSNRNDDWRVYFPGQPLPSDVSPTLLAIDRMMED